MEIVLLAILAALGIWLVYFRKSKATETVVKNDSELPAYAKPASESTEVTQKPVMESTPIAASPVEPVVTEKKEKAAKKTKAKKL